MGKIRYGRYFFKIIVNTKEKLYNINYIKESGGKVFLLSGGTIALIVVGVIAFLILIVVMWYISVLNTIRRMQVKIDEAESGIDVALTKRFDLLTKMVSTVKGYAKHEKETLQGVIEMRNPGASASLSEKSEFANQMTQATKSLNLVVERYPELQANQNFLKLQDSISEVEEHLQAARRLYNSNVSSYNQYIIVFPNTIVAGAKYTKREFFEVEETKKNDVNIEF